MKVKGNDSLARDEESRAIINTDSNALRKAKQAKRKADERTRREKVLEDRVALLESKIEELLKVKG